MTLATKVNLWTISWQSLCPAYAHGRPQARATGAGGRGWLPLPRPPQSPHGCLSGLRGLGAHYLQYPFAQAQLSNPQAARAAPPPTAPPAPPSPARAALRSIETFRRLLIDSKMRAGGGGGGGSIEGIRGREMAARPLALLLALAQAVSLTRANCPDTGPPCPHCILNRAENGLTTWITKDGKCHYKGKNKHCPITCAAGYDAQETWKTSTILGTITRGFVCGSDNVWRPQATDGKTHALDCQPIEGWCGGDPDSETGVVVPQDEDCLRRIGDTCSATCADEFRWDGTGSNQYKCEADKSWTVVGSSALQCERVCPTDPEPHAGFRSGCSHTVGSQCDAQCDPGYASISADPSMRYTCSEVDGWKPDTHALACQLHGCAEKVLTPHAEPCESAQQGGTCVARCELGFRADGGSANFTCASDGAWKADDATRAFTCTAIPDFCLGDPGVASDHIKIDPDAQKCVRELNRTCVAKCTDGTVPMPNTDLEYKCVNNDTRRDHGKWIPTTNTPLSCAKLCSHDRHPSEHAEFTASCKEAATHAVALCVATCTPGYRPVGGMGDYTCDPVSGLWGPFEAGQALVCARDCSEGQEPNATDPVQCVTCAAGLHSAGIRCIACGPDGVWVGGQCQPRSPPSSIGQTVEDWFSRENEPTTVAEVVVMVAAIVALVCACLAKRRASNAVEPAGVLRESFLGVEKLPAAKMTALDIPARWNKAASADRLVDDWSDVAGSSSSTSSSVQLSSSSSDASATRRRRAKGSDNVIHVMFTGEHVRELQPAEWMKDPLGTGSYGMVYKATWRGREVAVKVLKLPERTSHATAAANARLKELVDGITQDFVTEVEVCADLNHPNLVRLLGYADTPRLMIVQELCQGNSLDHQLYVEGWRPTHAQILKAATDVAKGMEYLHTRYNTPDNRHAQPIIHRDLKSPNLLLVAPPTETGRVVVKVTDFGLSRDKGLDLESQNHAQTVMMTGCGSVLWMAPEILLGNTYNEKVDVYSFAMCLAELVSGKLPWSGIAGGAEVPHKVTQGERPRMQVTGTTDRPVDAQIAELIQDCWVQDAESRPSFSVVVRRLDDLVRGTDDALGSTVSHSRSGSRSLRGGAAGVLNPVAEEDGASRPASRSASPQLPARPPAGRE
eukprot:COSAG02_NODE_275_length_26232_cov_85.210424_15_plen_1132_part_00